MPKPKFDDIKSKKVRREIESRVKRDDKIIEELYSHHEKESKPMRRSRRSGGGRGVKISLWFLATVSLIFLFFAISFIFSTASITINPKSVDVDLKSNLTAEKDNGSKGLVFDLVVISGEEKTEIDAVGEKDLAVAAGGVVVLYNTSTTALKDLSEGTRLSGSNGKIYKTTRKITIPAGKSGTPGKVEVGIVADQAGEEYNSGPLDFKIASFKGTSKDKSFYGRSKGDISGGLSGKLPYVEDSAKPAIYSSLKDALKNKLLQKATDQIPAGYILFKDAVFLESKEEGLPPVAGSNKVPFASKGTLYGFLLNEKDLAKKIAEKEIEKYDGSDIYILNLKNLKFSIENGANLVYSSVSSINFSVSGKTKIIWVFDENKFVDELVGKGKAYFSQVLAKYPNINSADLVIEPFWRNSFPEKKDKIDIVVNYPK